MAKASIDSCNDTLSPKKETERKKDRKDNQNKITLESLIEKEIQSAHTAKHRYNDVLVIFCYFKLISYTVTVAWLFRTGQLLI